MFTRDVNDTLQRHDVEEAVDRSDLSRSEADKIVAGLDLLILGGGGILYDADVEMYLREVALAKERGTPVMVYAVSAGPLVEAGNRALVRDALEGAATVTVRDRRARKLLDEIGVRREILVTADPALLLEPESLTLDEILIASAP